VFLRTRCYKEELTKGWRKVHNKGLHNLYCSPNIIRVIKSRSMRWAEHGVCMDEIRNAYKTSVGKLEGKIFTRWMHNPGHRG
jgi:predicted RNA binding protein YcfA (HicA-like mRNA interferase family)